MQHEGHVFDKMVPPPSWHHSLTCYFCKVLVSSEEVFYFSQKVVMTAVPQDGCGQTGSRG